MGVKRTGESQSDGITIRLSSWGLVVCCAALALAAGLLAYGLVRSNSGGRDSEPSRLGTPLSPEGDRDVAPAEIPPWGELLTSDIELEPPEEYAAFEIDTNRVASWVFTGMVSNEVEALMLSCGMSPDLITRALSPQLAAATASGMVIYPDDELVFSLSPSARAKLYGRLARDKVNFYMHTPFCFPEQTVQTLFDDSNLDPAVVTTVKKLLYPRGETQCFSDYDMVMRRTPSEADRATLARILCRQPAVMARLRIRRDTDIDKVLGYWGRGVQVKDVRPFLESLKRLPEGGFASILYLLPPFARQRLYTFPLPSAEGGPVLDCHWSTMNFFSETPDDRFADVKYTSFYLSTNFYQVARPTLYGDVVLLLDEHNSAVHSALHVADDIVFTKNGDNFGQPWMLMRLKDLVARYTDDKPPRVVIYRHKDW